jgi:RNA polymerase sigma-B factor
VTEEPNTPHAPEPEVALESDQELLERFVRTRDPDLREELAVRFAPLAEQLARRYANRGERLEDLQQVAYLGLLKAPRHQLPRLRGSDDPR